MLLLAFALVLWSPALLAQAVEGESLDDPKAEAQAYDIAQRTMSPFCPGRTLADCPSGKATEWRQDIRAMLQEGKSAAEIQQVLNDRAGENLTGAPASSLGWALPVGLCVGAIGVLSLVLVRIRREDKQPAAVSRPATVDSREESQGDDGEEGDDGGDTPKRDSAAEQQKEERLEERLRRELADDDN